MSMNYNLDDMKKEYESCMPPAELTDRLKASISQAKKDKRQDKIVHFTKKTGLCAAAALAGIVILANSNAKIAMAMEKVPVLGAITRVVTFRTYEDVNDNHEANIAVPQIDAEASAGIGKETAAKVNKSVEEYTNELIAQYEQDIADLGEEGHESLTSSYETVTDNDVLFTLRINSTLAMGSAAESSRFYHINKQTDSIITLPDLFKDGSDYVSALSDTIKAQMREQMKNNEELVYFIDSDMPETDFDQIKADQNFYINAQNQLVIVFDEYEAAPGYMGSVEFVIPTEAVQELLADNTIVK